MGVSLLLWAVKPGRRLVRVFLANGSTVVHMPDLFGQQRMRLLLRLISEGAADQQFEIVDCDSGLPLHPYLCRVRTLLRKPKWLLRVKTDPQPAVQICSIESTLPPS